MTGNASVSEGEAVGPSPRTVSQPQRYEITGYSMTDKEEISRLSQSQPSSRGTDSLPTGASEPSAARAINLAPLSKRARALAGVWFGMMPVNGRSNVTHHLRELKPTAETQAALDELVGAGVISREPWWSGGFVYKPLVDCYPAFRWMNDNIDDPELKFRLMEPASQNARSEAEERG